MSGPSVDPRSDAPDAGVFRGNTVYRVGEEVSVPDEVAQISEGDAYPWEPKDFESSGQWADRVSEELRRRSKVVFDRLDLERQFRNRIATVDQVAASEGRFDRLDKRLEQLQTAFNQLRGDVVEELLSRLRTVERAIGIVAPLGTLHELASGHRQERQAEKLAREALHERVIYLERTMRAAPLPFPSFDADGQPCPRLPPLASDARTGSMQVSVQWVRSVLQLAAHARLIDPMPGTALRDFRQVALDLKRLCE